MAAKNRPYEQFGTFILFKKLDTDSLGNLWRAARVDGSALGPMLALRRLSGGKREAMAQSASEASQLVPLLSGTTFAKDQTIDLVDGVPFVAHEYSGGRSLRHIVDRARGTSGSSPNPVPLDQAIVIAEKIALSLATTADLRYLGSKLAHGALIPQFVWITDEGEIRVAGQQLGKGIIASLSDAAVAGELGRYFPAEYRTSGEISKTTDVYSLGAILYLLVTGNEPPDAVTASAFTQTVRGARTFSGQPFPDDIRTIIEKSLAIDPSARYPSIAEMKQVLSALVHGGNYSASTFNLAFYLSNLLKKELENEAQELERESRTNLAAYVIAAASAPAPFADVLTRAEEAKSRAPLFAIAAMVVVAAGLGTFFLLKPKPHAPDIQAAAPPAKPKLISSPVIAAIPAAAAAAPLDPSAQKKAFEAAVEQKMQEEMMKLQSDMNRQLKQQQPRNTPVQTASVMASPQTQSADDRGSAAALDQRRVASRQEVPVPTQPVVQQPAPLTQPQPALTASIASAPVSVVREGDLVDVTELDQLPAPLSVIRPFYPPLAAQQRAKATVIISALISETGEVTEVKILRGDPRFGFNDAAIRAMRAVRFTPPMKDGKHVRTWRPQSITFTM